MAFEPPQKQALVLSGSMLACSSMCYLIYWDMTDWKSRTFVGNGGGPMHGPRQ